MAREMFYGFAMANKSISVAVIDVVRVGSLINCVKSKDLKISFNFLVLRLGFLGKYSQLKSPLTITSFPSAAA